MAVPLTPYLQYLTSNGLPRNGGKVFTYAAGTTTPKATYTTAAGTVVAANPVILNSSGLPDHGSGNTGMIWIQGSYDFVVTNADGTDPVTIPNLTSFNTIAAAGASYFQSFSGDGVTTSFALSQPLGTDENAVLFFVDNGLVNFITNGDFATDTIWTKGAGWTIGAGVATATGAISTILSQNANTTINAGQSYTIEFTVTASAGTVTPSIGGTAGTTRGAGTWRETIIAGSTQVLAFTGVGFTGTLDNVSVRLVASQGWQVVPPTEFTLNNTSIAFATAPRAGTNNIIGFAFSTLVAAASASAAAAEAFANAAGVSATNAAASATTLLATSTTSTLIGIGSRSFTTQTGKNFATGQFITISSNATPANFMFGQVTSYATLTGALVVNVTDTGGSGTFTDWNISVSGIKGIAGTVTPSNNSITFPMFTTGVLATLAEAGAGTASKIITAATFQSFQATPPIIRIQMTKASGTAGGRVTATSAWQDSNLAGDILLNTAPVTNNITGASLNTGTGVITLPAGTYKLRGWKQFVNTAGSRTRFFNITDSAVLVVGSSAYGGPSTGADTSKFDDAFFTLAATKTIKIQNWCTGSSSTTNDFGIPSTTGDIEVYGDFTFEKVA